MSQGSGAPRDTLASSESSPGAVLASGTSPWARWERRAPASELGCIAPTPDPETSRPPKDCQVLTGDERGLMPRDGRRAATV